MPRRITFLGFIVSQKHAYHRVWLSTFVPFDTARREFVFNVCSKRPKKRY